jgi:hypothetical protein
MILILLLIVVSYWLIQQLIYMQILPPQLYDKSWKLDLALGTLAAIMFFLLWKLLRSLNIVKARRL